MKYTEKQLAHLQMLYEQGKTAHIRMNDMTSHLDWSEKRHFVKMFFIELVHLDGLSGEKFGTTEYYSLSDFDGICSLTIANNQFVFWFIEKNHKQTYGSSSINDDVPQPLKDYFFDRHCKYVEKFYPEELNEKCNK